jgi:hypothetical protein
MSGFCTFSSRFTGHDLSLSGGIEGEFALFREGTIWLQPDKMINAMKLIYMTSARMVPAIFRGPAWVFGLGTNRALSREKSDQCLGSI